MFLLAFTIKSDTEESEYALDGNLQMLRMVLEQVPRQLPSMKYHSRILALPIATVVVIGTVTIIVFIEFPIWHRKQTLEISHKLMDMCWD